MCSFFMSVKDLSGLVIIHLSVTSKKTMVIKNPVVMPIKDKRVISPSVASDMMDFFFQIKTFGFHYLDDFIK